jgi:ABC-type polysaccharide/polyol phosphate export permease
MKEKLKDLFAYRELLIGLTRKEIKVKYKNSLLGFLWSMINPLMMLVVFYVAFGIIFRLRAAGGINFYAFFLMAGILPWNLFSTALMTSTGSVVANADLVKKVYFPREVLPLSYLGSASFHFILQEMVLIVFLLAFRIPLTPWIFAFPLLLLLQIIFLSGLSMLLSAVNVFFRDVMHFTEIFLLAWFWMTPIIYPVALIQDNMPAWAVRIYLLNPMAHIILLWQRIVYNSPVNGPDAAYFNPEAILSTVLFSIFLLVLGYYAFSRWEGKFAEFI